MYARRGEREAGVEKSKNQDWTPRTNGSYERVWVKVFPHYTQVAWAEECDDIGYSSFAGVVKRPLAVALRNTEMHDDLLPHDATAAKPS